MKEETRDLSASEAVIMRTVWEAGGVIPFLELKERLRKEYGKDYSRNSIATFLTRMEEKGFVERSRQGKASYIRALRNKDEYAYQQLQHDKEMWFSGRASNLVCALVKGKDISRDEASEIRRMLDELDEEEEKRG